MHGHRVLCGKAKLLHKPFGSCQNCSLPFPDHAALARADMSTQYSITKSVERKGFFLKSPDFGR